MSKSVDPRLQRKLDRIGHKLRELLVLIDHPSHSDGHWWAKLGAGIGYLFRVWHED